MREKVNGVVEEYEVPCGKAKSLNNGGRYHNEYIVYNTQQIKMRYLLKVKIN